MKRFFYQRLTFKVQQFVVNVEITVICGVIMKYYDCQLDRCFSMANITIFGFTMQRCRWVFKSG
jgi:hypothetical protein